MREEDIREKRLLVATAHAVEALCKHANDFTGEYFPEQEELSEALEAVEKELVSA